MAAREEIGVKQEKIRVKLEEIFGRPDLVDKALKYLHSKDVAIKVEGELIYYKHRKWVYHHKNGNVDFCRDKYPVTEFIYYTDELKAAIAGAGYTATKPLIKLRKYERQALGLRKKVKRKR